jgi:hypothetical protein
MRVSILLFKTYAIKLTVTTTSRSTLRLGGYYKDYLDEFGI